MLSRARMEAAGEDTQAVWPRTPCAHTLPSFRRIASEAASVVDGHRRPPLQSREEL
jgi:hypothetical protein